jgi:hypothetical protein
MRLIDVPLFGIKNGKDDISQKPVSILPLMSEISERRLLHSLIALFRSGTGNIPTIAASSAAGLAIGLAAG